MKVKVCIPAYNAEASIASTLNNIRMQTYHHFTVLVYDDGSSDQTANIVKKISGSDSRITLIKGEINKGRAFARNVLLSEAKNSLIAWQDADDRWHPQKLDTLLALLHENSKTAGNPIVYSSILRFPPRYTPLYLRYAEMIFGPQRPVRLDPPALYDKSHIFSRNFGKCPFYLQGTLGPAASFINAGGFNLDIGWAEDLDMAIRLLRNGSTILGFTTQRMLTRYYANVPSVSTNILRASILSAAESGKELFEGEQWKLQSDMAWRELYYIFKVALLKGDFAIAEEIMNKHSPYLNEQGIMQWGASLFEQNNVLLGKAREAYKKIGDQAITF